MLLVTLHMSGTADVLYGVVGELREYVVEELNVRALETCDQPLQYAQLRAEPDWKVLCSSKCLLHKDVCIQQICMLFIARSKACHRHCTLHLFDLRQSARGWPRPWARA